MLEVKNVSKRFPAVQALSDVSLRFEPGTVYGLIGENGAGKSTLMKILSGIVSPTSGEIVFDGKPVQFRAPKDAIEAGIATIHQELNLIDELSVGENLFLGREPTRGIAIDRDTIRERSRPLLEAVRANFDPDLPVGRLSIAGKQLVEIARSLATEARVVLMDEPTAVLSEPEVDALFALIRSLRSQGVSVVYISHHLSEVRSICDTVSVLRDGKLVATVRPDDVDPVGLAKLMVGRDLGDMYPEKRGPSGGDAVLELRGFGVPGRVEPIDLDLRPGEIVGFAGLIGSGRTELAEAIVGLRPHVGTLLVDGHPVKISSPTSAMQKGIAYVSEDRKGSGLHLSLDTVANTTLANLGKYATPFVNATAMRDATEKWVHTLDVRVGDVEAPIRSLSGGNQQKIAIAKWLDGKPRVLLLDEPTRGVDVGAKSEIYRLIHQLAGEGLACLVISSELPELLGLCHRIAVLRAGKLVGMLLDGEMSEEAIMLRAAGVHGEEVA